MGYFDTHRIWKWYTPTLLHASGTLAFSSLSFGFDTQSFNGIQALNSFRRTFGDQHGQAYTLPTYWTAMFNSMIFIGFFFGSYFGSMSNMRFGRRKTVIAMSLWSCVSAIILATSTNRWQLLVGRILNYLYIGCELVTLPLYQSEIVPGPVRGFAVGSYHLLMMLGSLIMGCVLKGCQRQLEGRVQWQVPFALLAFWPLVVAINTYFIPESPRWLILKGRVDEARAMHWRLHGARLGPEGAEEDFQLMVTAIEAEPEAGKWSDFKKGTNPQRLRIVVGQYFFLQATGQSFGSLYGGSFVRSLKVMDPINYLIMNFSICFLSTLVGVWFTDRIGRRSLLIVGGLVMGAGFLTMGGLGTPESPSVAARKAIIGVKMIYTVAYNLTWGSVNNSVCVEIAAIHLRDKSQRIGVLVSVVTHFVVAFSMAYALDSIGAKIGYVYGSMSLISAVFVYFSTPDCHGRTLEEVDQLFRAGIPVRKFHSTQLHSPDKEAQTLEKDDVLHDENSAEIDKVRMTTAQPN